MVDTVFCKALAILNNITAMLIKLLESESELSHPKVKALKLIFGQTLLFGQEDFSLVGSVVSVFNSLYSCNAEQQGTEMSRCGKPVPISVCCAARP